MSRSIFKIAGLELEVSDKQKHQGKQSSKWDDVRHHLVYGENEKEGKKKGDYKLDKTIEGFASMNEASACASRMRNAWGMPIKAYTNIQTGKFGICFKDADDEEEKEQAEPQDAVVTPDPSNDGKVMAEQADLGIDP